MGDSDGTRREIKAYRGDGKLVEARWLKLG